jgi:large subunit ribosomal protein L19
MDAKFMKKIEEKHITNKKSFGPGDKVKVHVNITEAGKERIQVFEGIVIAVQGKGISKSIVVRKISHGVGVERIFPVNSPSIRKIEIVEKGKTRRAKLYYMRERVGKRSLDVIIDEAYEGEVEEEVDELIKEGSNGNEGEPVKDVEDSESEIQNSKKEVSDEKVEEAEETEDTDKVVGKEPEKTADVEKEEKKAKKEEEKDTGKTKVSKSK